METNNFKDEKPIRSFIAVSIPEQIKSEIGRFQEHLKRTGADVKWVRPESMHITLRFLGNLSPEEIELAGEAVCVVAEKFSPVQVEIKGFGSFPERKRPRVIWAGLTRGEDELKEIFQSLEQELISRGLGEADRGFAGHLTIGRVKTGKKLEYLLEYLNKESERSFGIFEAKTICLFQSQLKPQGAIYTALRQAVLGGRSEGKK